MSEIVAAEHSGIEWDNNSQQENWKELVEQDRAPPGRRQGNSQQLYRSDGTLSETQIGVSLVYYTDKKINIVLSWPDRTLVALAKFIQSYYTRDWGDLIETFVVNLSYRFVDRWTRVKPSRGEYEDACFFVNIHVGQCALYLEPSTAMVVNYITSQAAEKTHKIGEKREATREQKEISEKREREPESNTQRKVVLGKNGKLSIVAEVSHREPESTTQDCCLRERDTDNAEMDTESHRERMPCPFSVIAAELQRPFSPFICKNCR